MAQVDPKLAASLKQAKTTPMFFVFVAKGNESKLLVAKKKISPKDAAEAKKECGGGTIYKGRCQGEEEKMVFEVGKEVPTNVPALTKKIIKQDAGLTFDVEYRVAEDLAAEESQEESAEESATPEVAEGSAEVIKRLNGMAADIKAALAGPNKARVQTLFVAVNGLIKAKDFVQADKVLDELAPLVKQMPVAQPPPRVQKPAPQVTPDASLEKECERRLAAMDPKIAQAEKAKHPEAKKCRSIFESAYTLSSDGKFAQAIAELNKLDTLLNPAFTKAKEEYEAAAESARLLMAHLHPEDGAAVREYLEEVNTVLGKSKATLEDFTAATAKLDELKTNLQAEHPDAYKEANSKSAPTQETAMKGIDAALAQWTTARGQVIERLKAVEAQIRAMKDPEGDAAIILVKAIQANLSPRPATVRAVAELERYITTDNVIADAEGIVGIPISNSLLPVLRSIRSELAAATPA